MPTGSCAVNSVTPGPGCFAGNIIPAGQINAQAQLLMKIMYDNTLALNPSFRLQQPRRQR